jgi:hypothetical protein
MLDPVMIVLLVRLFPYRAPVEFPNRETPVEGEVEEDIGCMINELFPVAVVLSICAPAETANLLVPVAKLFSSFSVPLKLPAPQELKLCPMMLVPNAALFLKFVNGIGFAAFELVPDLGYD